MKKHMFHQDRRRFFMGKSMLLIPCLVLFSLLLSCNTKQKDGSSTADTTSGTTTETAGSNADSKAAMNSFNGSFPYLTISKEDLATFFTPPNVQKLVFRFQFTDGTSLPSLVAFKATSVRVYDPIPLMPRLEKQPFSRPLGAELFLGNLEMSKQQYTALTQLGSYGSATHLLFGAKKEGLNVIYEVTWVTTGFTKDTKFEFDQDFDLNPSPPDPPSGSN